MANPIPQYVAHVEDWHALAVSMTVLLLTGFLVSYLKSSLDRTVYIEGLLEKITSESDIRRKTADYLRESEERYHSLISNIPSVTWITNNKGETTFISPNIEKVYGYTAEEIYNASESLWFGRIHPDDIEEVKDAYGNLFKEEGHYDVQYRIQRKDGEWIWLHDRAMTTYEKEDLQFAYGVFSDITVRKNTEEALKISKEKYRTLFERESDAIFIFDPDTTNILDVNKATSKMYGYDKDELIGMSCLNLNAEVEESASSIERIRKDDEVNVSFRLHRKKDGTVFPVDISAYTITLGGKKVMYAISKDITTRTQAEEELEKHREHLKEMVEEQTSSLEERTENLNKSEKALRYILEDVNDIRADLEIANKKLKELDHLKSMFIASMSHELRTPLNSIIGFTGIILQGMAGEISEEQRDHLERVYRSGQHLLDLISDIIDISKIEAGKMEARVEAFELDLLIYDAVESLKPQIEKKGLGINITVLPDIQMNTDRKRLFQCILNFLSNAVKFTEKGEIVVTENENDGMIEIKVRDTGIGMKEEDMQKLFGSFVRLESHLKTIAPGTGLGLYLTKKTLLKFLEALYMQKAFWGKAVHLPSKFQRNYEKSTHNRRQ